MGKLRIYFNQLKDDWYEAKDTTLSMIAAHAFLILLLLISIFLSTWTLSHIFKIPDFIVLSIYAMAIIFEVICFKKGLLMQTSFNIILKVFGRYGKVMTKDIWDEIKHDSKKLYKEAICNKSKGKCYDYSRALAFYLKDAQLMYGAFYKEEYNHTYSGHAVIVKDGIVYDTNGRWHYNYELYLKLKKFKIYKFFSYEEYSKRGFMDKIRPGFVAWCKKEDVYVDF